MTQDADTARPLFSDIASFLETLRSPISALEVQSGKQTETIGFPQEEEAAEQPVTIFLAYVSIDDEFRKCIERDIRTLSRQGSPIKCETYDVNEALELSIDIENPLKAYELFLFLLSPEFVELEYCYSTSVRELIKKHMDGVWVSPILVRECLWEETPFGQTNRPLPILPSSRLPIRGSPDEDKEYKKIANSIKRAIDYLRGNRV